MQRKKTKREREEEMIFLGMVRFVCTSYLLSDGSINLAWDVSAASETNGELVK